MRTVREYIAWFIVMSTLLAILGCLMASAFVTFGWISIVVAVWIILFVILRMNLP